MINAIIFDWHGVLDQTKLAKLIEKLGEITRLPLEEITEKVRPIEIVYAKGLEDPNIFWDKVRNLYNLSSQQLEEVKKTILSFEPNEVLWDKLPTLKEKYKLAVLSDCPADKVAIIKEKADLSFFEFLHFSATEHLRKDSEDFFQKASSKLGENSSNCLYVDDNLNNCHFAQKLGFKVCNFKQISDLEKMLENN